MRQLRASVSVLLAALVLTGCAASPEMQARREAAHAEIAEILSGPPDAESRVQPQRCLADLEYRSYRALDDRYLLFEGRRGKFWINTLRTRCPDLRFAHVLVVRSKWSSRRLCDMDTFVPSDWFMWPWYRRWPWQWGSAWHTGMTCTLGEFYPVVEWQIEAIESAIESIEP